MTEQFRLPVATEDDVGWILQRIEDCAKNAGRALALYFVAVLYGGLTLMSVSDRHVVLNQGVSLPVVNVTVPLDVFWWAYPLFATALFFHYVVYLYRLRLLRMHLDTCETKVYYLKVYPWFVIIGEQSQFIVGWVFRCIVHSFIWLSLPALLVVNAISSIRGHNQWTSFLLASLAFIGIFFAVIAWVTTTVPKAYPVFLPFLRQSEEREAANTKQDERIRQAIIRKSILYVSTSVVLAIVIVTTFSGMVYAILKARHIHWFTLKATNTSLITEPARDYPELYWADLHNRNFDGADFSHSILKRANLRGACLRNAKLVGANLDSADLTGAHLDSADLRGASLRWAILDSAQLRHAILHDAVLDSAKLRDARLNWADLCRTNLRYARLNKAILENALLNRADLSHATLVQSEMKMCYMSWATLSDIDGKGINLCGATLFGTDLTHANLSSYRYMRDYQDGVRIGASIPARCVDCELASAIFVHADLSGADLRHSDLTDARFDSSFMAHTRLDSAKLRETSMRGVYGLDLPQLSSAIILWHLKLDATLATALREAMPPCLHDSLESPPRLPVTTPDSLIHYDDQTYRSVAGF